MRFGVLGPLEVWSDGGEAVPVAGPRPRALLSVLLLDAGRVVGVDRLVAAQYGDDPPPGAAHALQAHVSRLRRGLPPGLVEFAGGGYRLAVDPEDVDVHRFARLTADGRALLAAGRSTDAAAALREALALWRGPALPDLPDGRDEVSRLDELRLTAVEDLVDADPGGTSVADLQRLVAEHPLRERPARPAHARARRRGPPGQGARFGVSARRGDDPRGGADGCCQPTVGDPSAPAATLGGMRNLTVLISGASIAGPALALRLARLGCPSRSSRGRRGYAPAVRRSTSRARPTTPC